MVSGRTRGVVLALILAVSAVHSPIGSAPRPEDPFPDLPGLHGNVDFWIRVFAEWTVGQAAVHDMEHPAIIYEIVDLPGPNEDTYTEEQQDFLEDLRERWAGWLVHLEDKFASGETLDATEREWLDYITEQAGADALKTAHARLRTQRGLRERCSMA